MSRLFRSPRDPYRTANPPHAGLTFGQREPIAPRFYWSHNHSDFGGPSSGQIEVLGRFQGSSAPSLVATSPNPFGYRPVFSMASALPAPLLRVIAAAAGVTLYAVCSTPAHPHDCTVRAAGNALYIHAGPRAGPRQITLPERLSVKDEESSVICSGCTTFNVNLAAADTRLFTVSRMIVG